MSKTKKDRPYRVKAAEASKGVTRHHKRCNNLNRELRSENYTRTETHIFYAHEVAEMEIFESTVLDNDGAFTMKEKSGYAILRDENDLYDIFMGRAELKPPVREDVVELQSSGLGSNGVRTYSSYNVFYIYEVTYSSPNKNFGTDCCEDYLPKSMTSKNGDCSCCKNQKTPERNTKIRDELKAEIKKANSV